VIVRRVDVAPPPPPPPEVQSDSDSGAISLTGINLDSIIPAVDLNPIASGASLDDSDALDLGLSSAALDIKPQINFNMKEVVFVDRPPIMIVRPTLYSEYMHSQGIDQFEVLVMVKWLEDGSLSFLGIEEIEYPDEQLAALTRDVVARIRYSRPTVNGVPVERIIRLPLTIHSN
jgi:hypothetical protein